MKPLYSNGRPNTENIFLIPYSEVRERRLFENDVFADCVCSDDEILRQLVARLLKLAFRGPNNDVAQPAEVLRRAVQLHLQFRVSYLFDFISLNL